MREITKEFSKKLKYHRLTGLRILQVNPALPKSPREENISSLISYKVQADLELDEQVVAAEKKRAGRGGSNEAVMKCQINLKPLSYITSRV